MQSRFRNLALSVGGAVAALLAAPPALAEVGDEPLARFEDPICPGIAGLRVEAAEIVVGRIRENVQAFDRRLAPPETCEPNLIVAVVDDSQAFLEELRSKNGWVFAELSRQDRDAALGQSGPARALLRVRARSRDGMPIARREDLVDLPQTYMWSAHSKIYTATRNDILSALVLFDRESVRGLTLTQLADYATFRALTRTLPETADARGASIVALFDGGAARPAELTEFDRAYLGKLYEGLPNIPGALRLAELEKATGRNVFEQ